LQNILQKEGEDRPPSSVEGEPEGRERKNICLRQREENDLHLTERWGNAAVGKQGREEDVDICGEKGSLYRMAEEENGGGTNRAIGNLAAVIIEKEGSGLNWGGEETCSCLIREKRKALSGKRRTGGKGAEYGKKKFLKKG